MSQVNVTISGRVYRMACEDGQEAHLQGLADKLDKTIVHLRETFGEIGDQRLTVMAAIMAMDEASEVRRRLDATTTERDALRAALGESSGGRDRLETDMASRLDDAARRIESLAASLSAPRSSN